VTDEQEDSTQMQLPTAPVVSVKGDSIRPGKWTSFAFSTVALVVSGLSLVVSGLSFYFTNVRIADSVVARVIDVELVPESYGDSPHGDLSDILLVRVAFANDGNRPAVVLSLRYHFDCTDYGSGLYGDVALSQQGQDSYPLVLQAHEVRVVNKRWS